ncbi:MAG: 50S ribosomal protein L23 [bacterium]
MGLFDRFKSKKEQELKDKRATTSVPEVAPETVTKTKKEEASEEKLVEKTTELSTVKKLKGEAARILVAPVVTEKSAYQANDSKYTFEVIPKANKIQVKKAIEQAYGVHVTRVNMESVRGKYVRFGRFFGRERSWKKAIVTLKKGERLDVYEGLG